MTHFGRSGWREELPLLHTHTHTNAHAPSCATGNCSPPRLYFKRCSQQFWILSRRQIQAGVYAELTMMELGVSGWREERGGGVAARWIRYKIKWREKSSGGVKDWGYPNHRRADRQWCGGRSRWRHAGCVFLGRGGGRGGSKTRNSGESLSTR